MMWELIIAIITIFAGVLVIAVPKLLRYVIGLYLIITGIFALVQFLLVWL